ncbi:hypothetical protein ALP64_203239 [Pseudomonas syringae pv. actinidiae]|nr:hypothetical protein ALP64_203239 [Pseudomonas syringae pv. actinidiae]
MFLLAIAIPGFAQFAAATHMRDGKGHTTVEQAQTRVGKPRVQALAVGTIAIQVQRGRLADQLALDHQADRHLRTVAGRGPQTLADIGIGVERAQHWRLLEHHLLASGQGQLTHLSRAVQRLIAKTNPVAVELQRVLHIKAVGSIW